MSTMTVDRMTFDRPTRRPRPAAPVAPARAERRRTTRLTRRGRLVVVLGVLVLLVVGFSFGQDSSQAARHADRPATVTVQPGESLWAVATRIAPHTDPRLVVEQLEAANHLPSAEVFAGQQLIVPS